VKNARNGKPTEAKKSGAVLGPASTGFVLPPIQIRLFSPGIPRWQAVGVEKVASKIFVKKFTDKTFPDELELA